jgi:hypothetical protein
MHVTLVPFALALLLVAPLAMADAPSTATPVAPTPASTQVDALDEVERGLQLERPSVTREIVLHHAADAPPRALSLPPAPPAPPAPAPPAPTPHGTWYGWQPLAVDTASIAVVALSVSRFGPSNSEAQWALAAGGAGSFALGGPIIHAAHGRWGAAAGDLALRVGVPLVTGLIGFGIASTQTPSPPAFCNAPAPDQELGCALYPIGNDAMLLGGALLGAGAGALAVSLVDAVFLARTPATAPSEQRPALTWSPTVSVRPEGGASAGIVGRF